MPGRAGAEGQRRRVAGRNPRVLSLHVHEWGEPAAPAVVCLHGVTAHGRRFARLAARLSSRFRVLAPDLRGHGRSEWEPPWSLETHVADVLTAMDEAGVDRADLVGHSFGGRVALELLAASPGRVRRLVLLDPAIWVPPPIALERAELNRVPPAFQSRDEALAARIATDLHHTPMDMLDEEMDDHLVAGVDGLLRYRYAPSAVVAAYGEMARRPPPWDQLPAPILLVRGVESEVVPEAVVGLVRAGLGDRVEIVDVPGGHNVTWDAFEETASVVKPFLEDSGA